MTRRVGIRVAVRASDNLIKLATLVPQYTREVVIAYGHNRNHCQAQNTRLNGNI